jgi:hypothetical protein
LLVPRIFRRKWTGLRPKEVSIRRKRKIRNWEISTLIRSMPACSIAAKSSAKRMNKRFGN